MDDADVAAREMGTAPPAAGIGAWLGLYVTGAFLVVFVLAHLWALHYGIVGPITARAVAERLRAPLFQVLDLGLLALAITHGLLGLRRMLLEFEGLGPRVQRAIPWALLGIGLATFAWGMQIFRAFLDRKSTRLNSSHSRASRMPSSA